jgi:hypothetical protein
LLPVPHALLYDDPTPFVTADRSVWANEHEAVADAPRGRIVEPKMEARESNPRKVPPSGG